MIKHVQFCSLEMGRPREWDHIIADFKVTLSITDRESTAVVVVWAPFLAVGVVRVD